jgi:hypothetical protein
MLLLVLLLLLADGDADDGDGDDSRHAFEVLPLIGLVVARCGSALGTQVLECGGEGGGCSGCC